MQIIVIGAGAWGLPTAAELAERGHRVTLVDRYGPGNALSSSHGPTRIWRLADPDPAKIAMTRQSLEAMERLSSIAGEPVFLRRGLVWRDDRASLDRFEWTLAMEGIPHLRLGADRVATRFPGLVPDGRGAIYTSEAGPVLAEVSLRAQLRRFEQAGGELRIGHVVDLETDATGTGSGGGGARVHLEGGEVLEADALVIAAGPGASTLLGHLGLSVPLRPHLEQVVHVADPARPFDDLPDLIDIASGERPTLYAMTTPRVGYKLGLDAPLRDVAWGVDDDRTPDESRTAMLLDYARSTLGMTGATVVDAKVCSWTDSPDGRFVIGTPLPGVTVACGDSGEGFKFSALMGLVLADLAEGAAPRVDLAPFAFDRFDAVDPEAAAATAAALESPTALGGAPEAS
ncbi:FAD-dependent oxidoreductase [Agromyces endophyticus]|uniref:FAD-dependent oxidoreductase n=1 Tax=Agromyces sp. H17E-10 TaxID=2932244 RepID=UPI001FD19020|nr:FAD-dependent oxidoreductase [Agromyces sp. H17E-10]UOQ90128.1 FAD-dependent oxidoreductase [Agromyces sp. H17E-10]